MESVLKYVENNEEVVNLHSQMQECDSVLARMEEMLHGFQADLGEISEEIKHLQDDSLSMSIRLKNRRAVEEKMHMFLEKAAIKPSLASSIMSPHVNDLFLDAVVNLSSRLKFLERDVPATDGSSLDIAPSETYSGRTLLPELEKLKVKALAKIRDYFTAQFNAIRKPKTNIQMLQQNSLVRFAPLIQFVHLESPAVAEDLRSLYIESMGKTLQNLFKCYYTQLVKMEQVMASKGDLVAVEEATLKSIFTQKVDMTKRNDTFALCEREKILDQIESEPILVHVALAENQKHPYEVFIRSILKHLIDSATNEFLFVIDFFKTQPRDTFNRIFGKTLSMILENLENYLVGCYDPVGLLIMIKMTYLLRLVMQRRRIPVLDSFFDRISMLLWPRFKQVFDANLKSIKYANPKKLGTMDLAPHFVSRRYAQLVSSIVTLYQGSSESWGIGGGGESMIQNDLHQIRIEMIGMLGKLANLLPVPKERIVFLINNYDQILLIFEERRIMCEEVQKFEDLLMQQRELFAEEEIRANFPRLIAYVLQTEKLIIENPPDLKSRIDETATGNLVREFATTWRTGIQQINDDVLSYFANFRNGMEILKQVLTQLLLYYTRFQDIIKKTWTRAPSFSRDIVSTATILMEIKRYSRTF